MTFATPQLTGLALLAMAVISLLVILAGVRRRSALRRLASTALSPHLFHVDRVNQALKSGLMLAATALLGLSLVGPQWGEERDPETPPPSSGRDILFLLDVSRSMLAEDVAPSRLQRAKADIHDLVQGLERRSGCRVGLVAFADRAVLLCPLTSDFRTVEEELTRTTRDSLRLRGDGGDAGTQIGGALFRAAMAIDPENAPFTDILLISDGGDMDRETLAAADELARLHVPVHALGLGDPTQGALIPIHSPGEPPRYLQFQGETVKTRLEEAVLREIAGRTGGQYVAVGTGYLDVERWYAQVASGSPTQMRMNGSAQLQPIPRFRWFLGPAVILLLLQMFLSEARTPSRGLPRPYFVNLRRRKRSESLTKEVSS